MCLFESFVEWQLFILLIIAVIIVIRSAREHAKNDRDEDQDNLNDRCDGYENNLAVSLIDLGQEVVWNLGVFITAVIDKGKRVDGLVSFSQLVLLPKDEEDADDQDNHLDGQAAANRSLHLDFSKVLLLTGPTDEAESHHKRGKEAYAVGDGLLDDHGRLV